MSRKRFTNGVLIGSAMVLLSIAFTLMLVKAWEQEERQKPTRAEVIANDPAAVYHAFKLREMFIRDEKESKRGEAK